MATLEVRIKALATQIATDVKDLTTTRGNLATLTTTAKNNLVAALNELKAAIDTVSGSVGAQINDTVTNTTNTWSGAKISADISAAVAALLNSAPGALDTLGELATALQANDGALASLTTALGNRVRFDAAQTLTAPQITQVCANIGIGEPDADLLAHYTAAKA